MIKKTLKINGVERILILDIFHIYMPEMKNHRLRRAFAKQDRKSTRLNSSHSAKSRMPSSA